MDFNARPIPAQLVARYRADGWWGDQTLGQVLEETLVAHRATRLRIWSQTRPYEGSLEEVTRMARALAGGLRRMGVQAGDVVSFQLPNWVEAAAAFYGTALLGAVVVPVVHIYGEKELRYILKESAARVHITASSFGHLAHAEIVEGLRPELPALEHVVVVGSDDVPAGFVRFAELIDGPVLREAAGGDADRPAVLAYTSGTTSNPKGVVHSHNTLLSELRQMTSYLPPEDALPSLMGSPVSHATGMLGGLLGPLIRGNDINLIDRWDPAVVIDAFTSAGVSLGGGATVFLTSLLDHPMFSIERHLPHVRYMGLGGAPIPAPVAERADALGITLIRAYGSTEHPSITGSAYGDPREKRLYTDGRALGGVDLRVVDPAGDPCPPGEAGEIQSRGPELCIGYTDEALTAKVFLDGGWYATGDVGVLDEDGFLTITDRLSDIIIRGGENISAAEVEDVIGQLPAVAEVAVVAAPDARLGEHACAFVRVRGGAAEFSIEELRGHLERAGLARQKWPEELRFIDEFDRTASGKVKKYALRASLR